MSAQLVCLTLIATRSLRDELFDYLGEQRDLASGFTASEVAGHGPDVRLQTPAERVKGHADEIMVRTILKAEDAALLLERLKTAARQGFDERIYLRGSKAASYGRVAEVMSLLQSAGYKKMALVTEQEKK